MGTSPFPRLPGWYGDPDDPNQFRYWDGEAWTFERRRRPSWVEQSAKNLTPAVPARRSDAGQPTTSRADVTLDGPARHLRAQSLRPYRPLTPVWPDNDSVPRRSSSARRSWWRDEPLPMVRPEPITPVGRLAAGPGRWPLIGFLLMCVLAMLGLASTFGLSSAPEQTVSAVAMDTGYISQANADCGRVLPRLRDTPGPSGGSRVSTGSMTAPGTNHGSSGVGQAGGTLAHLRALSRLRIRLGHIPESRAAAPSLTGWLAQWRTYIHDRHGYLTSGAGQAKTRLASEAQRTAKQSDQFALANGLVSCTLLTQHSGNDVLSF